MNHAEEVAKFAAILEQKGLLSGIEGNISVIDRETGHIFITPSRRMKLLLTPEVKRIFPARGDLPRPPGCQRRRTQPQPVPHGVCAAL